MWDTCRCNASVCFESGFKTLAIAALFAILFACCARSDELDAYGGWADIRGKASGAFHIDKINGRYLLITPDGHGFVALGVNHLGAIKSNGQDARLSVVSFARVAGGSVSKGTSGDVCERLISLI